jgi:hypothetical protein
LVSFLGVTVSLETEQANLPNVLSSLLRNSIFQFTCRINPFV